MMTCCNCRFRISFYNAEQGGTITSMRLIKNHYNQTSITLYKKTTFFFYFFNGNSIQMACIVHHMWLHVMQYAHCTQIISSLITHIVLYEGLKQRKQTWNASCICTVLKRPSVYFYCSEKNSTRQCVCKSKGVYLLSAPLCAQCRKFCMWNQWNLQCMWLVSK